MNNKGIAKGKKEEGIEEQGKWLRLQEWRLRESGYDEASIGRVLKDLREWAAKGYPQEG